jgi:hypothetical protein
MKASVTTDHDHTPCPHFEKSILATVHFLRQGRRPSIRRPRPAKRRHGGLRHSMHALARCRLPGRAIRADERAGDRPR